MTAREILGGLECRIVGGPTGSQTRPALAVVLCHGYGAPGDDLVPIGRQIAEDDPVLGALVRFVFPAAPLVLGGQGLSASRAWWPLDERVLESAAAGRSPLDIRRQDPPELPAARAQIEALIEELQTREGLPVGRIMLAGFSQGAMLALDTTLHLPESPAALCAFSATLLTEARWRAAAPARRGLPVLLTHGRQDTLLSFAAAESLRDLLQEAGLEVDFIPFDGPHTIPPEAHRRMVRLLRRLVGDAGGQTWPA